MRSECLSFLLGLCLVIIHKDGHCQYITIGVGGRYKWDHKVGAGNESERYLLVLDLHQNNYATGIFSETVVLYYHLRAVMYRNGSVERFSVDIIATGGKCKTLLLNFAEGVILFIYLFYFIFYFFFVYEATQH